MKKKIDIFKNNSITKEVKEYIFNPVFFNKKGSLYGLLKKQYEEVSLVDIKKIIKVVEEELYEEVLYISVLLYRLKQLSDQWGEYGQQQCRQTFAHSFLKVSITEEISFDLWATLEVQVSEKLEEYELLGKSVEQLRVLLNSKKIKILGHTFKCSDYILINKIIHFIGSKKHLIISYTGTEPEVILGTVNRQEYGNHFVYWVEKEDIRTPNMIMPKVAFSLEQEAYVRHESLEMIYLQKWKSIFNYDEFEKNWIESIRERKISEGIKQKVMSCFNAETVSQFEDKKTSFIKDLGETVAFHEIGHIVMQHYIFDLEVGAISEATKVYGEKIPMALLEVMADFSPSHLELKGPIKNIVDVSKNNEERATRMFYMYLSDTWFFDTNDLYMYSYSDLVTLSLLRYIKKDQTIDFKKMNADFEFDPKEKLKRKEDATYVHFLMNLTEKTTKEIKEIAKKMEYELSGELLSFEKVKELIYINFKKTGSIIDETSYKLVSSLWIYMLGFLMKKGMEKEKMENYIKERETEVLKKVFVATAGSKVAQAYQYDHRRYIMDQMEARNLVWNKNKF